MGTIAGSSLAGTRHADGVSEDLLFRHGERVLCVADGMSEGRGAVVPDEIRGAIERDLVPRLEPTSGMWEAADHARLRNVLSGFVEGLSQRLLGLGAKASVVLAVRAKPGTPCVYVYALGDVACYLAGPGLLSWTPANYPLAARQEGRAAGAAVERYLGASTLPEFDSCLTLIASPAYCDAAVIRPFAQKGRFLLLDQGAALVMASDGIWSGFGDPARFREEVAAAAGRGEAAALDELTRRLCASPAAGGDDCTLALWVLGEESDFRRPLVDRQAHRDLAEWCAAARNDPRVAAAAAQYGERLVRTDGTAETGPEAAAAQRLLAGMAAAAPAVRDAALLSASLGAAAAACEERLRQSEAVVRDGREKDDAGDAADVVHGTGQEVSTAQEQARRSDVELAGARNEAEALRARCKALRAVASNLAGAVAAATGNALAVGTRINEDLVETCRQWLRPKPAEPTREDSAPVPATMEAPAAPPAPRTHRRAFIMTLAAVVVLAGVAGYLAYALSLAPDPAALRRSIASELQVGFDKQVQTARARSDTLAKELAEWREGAAPWRGPAGEPNFLVLWLDKDGMQLHPVPQKMPARSEALRRVAGWLVIMKDKPDPTGAWNALWDNLPASGGLSHDQREALISTLQGKVRKQGTLDAARGEEVRRLCGSDAVAWNPLAALQAYVAADFRERAAAAKAADKPAAKP